MGGKSSDPNKAAMKAQKEQMERLDEIALPELQEYILQNPELVGLLDAEEIGKSQMEGISTDPRLKQAQLDTLSSLEQESKEGLTSADRLAMEELTDQAGAQGQAQRAAIQAQMERQGLGNSGAALAAKLQGAQGSSNALRKQAMQMLAQSGDRRRQASRDRANFAGQMEGQDFSRQAQIASAQDAINRANAMNRQQVNQMNLAARQDIANQRTNTANAQAGMTNQIAQQNFQNQISKATGQGSVANAMSNIAANTPAKPSAFQSALGGAATGAGIGASFGGPMGAGIGAGVGALGGLVGGLEDGGIAGQEGGVPVDRRALEAHQKQEANFKKKYMKKIHSELLGEDKPKYANGGLAQTNYEDPKHIVGTKVSPDFSGLPVEYGGQPKSLKDMLNFPDKVDGVTKIGMGNDTTSAEVQNLKQARDLQSATPESEKQVVEAGSKIGAGDITKGLGALNKLLGAKPQEKSSLNLGQFSMQQPENVMSPVEALQYSNPYAQRAEDGALIKSMEEAGELTETGSDFASPDDRQSAVYSILNDAMSRMNQPEIPMSADQAEMEPMIENVMSQSEKGSGVTDFASPEDRQSAMFAALKQQMEAMNPKQVPMFQDGGTYQAEDGSLMFTSDGMGDIVAGDSFERDRVDARLNSGEMVLNAAQQQRLMDMLRGEISPEELGDEDIVEGVPSEYQEDLLEGESGDSKAKGFNRLLDMLGK